MPDAAFQQRIERIKSGRQWTPAGVVGPSLTQRRIRKVMRMADTFILYLRGPLMLATGFFLGTQVASHWASLSLNTLGF